MEATPPKSTVDKSLVLAMDTCVGVGNGLPPEEVYGTIPKNTSELFLGLTKCHSSPINQSVWKSQEVVLYPMTIAEALGHYWSHYIIVHYIIVQ